MNSLKPLGAVFSMLLLLAFPAGANDDFAQRRVLPSQETVEISMHPPATVTYEALDPLTQPNLNYNPVSTGSIWFEWTAPRDGIFKLSAQDPDSTALDVFVWEGSELDRMVRVQNGNDTVVAWDHTTVFDARQGRKYQFGLRVSQSPTRGDLGTLRLTPSAPVPVNDTIAARHPLNGPLPVTVRGSNLSPGSQEATLLQHMAALGGRPYNSAQFGSAYWWEWTCPATGAYEFKTDLLPWVYVGHRLIHDDGTTTAGDWVHMDDEYSGLWFVAEAGHVYDFALTSGGPQMTQNNYGEFSLTFQRLQYLAPPNAQWETAVPLPAAVPFDFTDHWPGGRLPLEEAQVPLWYRFTAPADGYYQFDFHQNWPQIYEEVAQEESPPVLFDLSIPVQYLKAGQSLSFLYQPPAQSPFTVRLSVSTLPALPVADNIADAMDMGSALEFPMRGHAGLATLEPEEADHWDGLSGSTGTLWWRWTAPGNGWLLIKDGMAAVVPIEAVRDGDSVLHLLQFGAVPVQTGQSWLIRAAFGEENYRRTLSVVLMFHPAVTNFSWQTATDLGALAVPRFYPSPWTPSVDVKARPWFRWTATETLRAGLIGDQVGFDIAIFTNPESGKPLARDAASWTWEFTAGQTYWLRCPWQTTRPFFEFQRTPFTLHGDISSAQLLTGDLPCGGTIATRGDTNSAAEEEKVPWAGTEYPIVWWKWQPQSARDVRLQVDSIEGYAPLEIMVFTGTAAGPGPEVQETAPRSSTHSGFPLRYFHVQPGETIWIAAVGFEHSYTYIQHLRAELREVFLVHPPNDNFSARTEIAPDAWMTGSTIYGLHYVQDRQHPLRYEISSATLEPGEPPVNLLIGEKHNTVQQTATTWWKWTAPSDGIYRMDIQGEFTGNPLDFTLDLYTGDTLATLHPAALYEPFEGQYLFRAVAGLTYTFRVASGPDRRAYGLAPGTPWLEQIFDYHALEELRFEDVGHAYDTYAGDGVSNIARLMFGFDLYLPLNHPANAAAQARLPHQVDSPGSLEMRCAPVQSFAPAGMLSRLGLWGYISDDLRNWDTVESQVLPNGEVSLRTPLAGSRAFLKWTPLLNLSQ